MDGAGSGVQVAGCELRVAGCELRVAGCGLHVAGSTMPTANCLLHTTCVLFKFNRLKFLTIFTNMKFSESFLKALSDYRSLLDKSYPQKSVLKMVGDRYALSRTERNILYRGVAGTSESEFRKAKRIAANALFHQILYVDALNQLYTLAAYLNGNAVFISTDGFLRDAAAVHGSGSLNKHLNKSLQLILSFLKNTDVADAVFYIDEKVNQSREIAGSLEQISTSHRLSYQSMISQKVDQDLRIVKDGIIATADSQIIEKATVPVFDLARHVLEYHFSPDFPDLNLLLF